VFVRAVAMLGLLVCLAGSAALAGCAGPPVPGEPRSPAPAWNEVHLPDTGAGVIVGDLRRCGARWYAAGAVLDPATSDGTGATRPALWTSDDGRAWRSLPTAPVTYYGRQQVLYSLACGNGSLAALGAKNGGQHGVPRISSWRGAPLTEIPGPSELYGGPRAMTVAAIAAGPSGWLIAGNRVGPNDRATATVWHSPDAAAFVEDAAAPGLASTDSGDTTARGITASNSNWYVFGDIAPPDTLTREAAVWSSADGRTWTRTGPPREHEDASITALALADAGDSRGSGDSSGPGSGSGSGSGSRMLAMGTLALAPHAWFYDGSAWSDAGGFRADVGAGVPRIGGLTLHAGQAYAVVDGGSRWGLWYSSDLHRWQPVPTPAQPPSGADDRLLLGTSADLLVLAATDDTGSRLWTAPLP
jgi:hypothetical protein